MGRPVGPAPLPIRSAAFEQRLSTTVEAWIDQRGPGSPRWVSGWLIWCKMGVVDEERRDQPVGGREDVQVDVDVDVDTSEEELVMPTVAAMRAAENSNPRDEIIGLACVSHFLFPMLLLNLVLSPRDQTPGTPSTTSPDKLKV